MGEDETQKLISSIVTAVRSEQTLVAQAAKKSRAWKDVAAAILFFTALIGGGAVTLQELQAKPTLGEVREHIEEAVKPVREKAREIDAAKADGVAIKKDLTRVKKVQIYQLEQSAWQGDVLEHIANKKRGTPPERPGSLDTKELELLQ